MNKLDLLKQSIRKNIPSLMEIGKGLLFLRKRIDAPDELEDILEFCGSSTYSVIYHNSEIDHFGRFDKKQPLGKIIGKEPMLNDVLAWFKLSKYEYAHFEGHYFLIYNGDEKCDPIEWDLSKPYLKDQSEQMIDFLYEEVLSNSTNYLIK